MWRRILSSSNLKTLTLAAAASSAPATAPSCRSAARLLNRSPASASGVLFSRGFSADSESNAPAKKKVEDVMPIATGHERDELEVELEGRELWEIDHPAGPFGTKEAPAVIKSTFDKRIVGCPGGDGEDEHDVVWFWLEKGKPHECPVCSQYFVLEVVGPGGSPDGHDDDDHHHH